MDERTRTMCVPLLTKENNRLCVNKVAAKISRIVRPKSLRRLLIIPKIGLRAGA